MASNVLLILGAADPEAQAIENLARAAGLKVAYATAGGVRVHPGNAYKSEWLAGDTAGKIETIVLVECDGRPLRDFARDERANIVVVDHHRPGDPGYGRPPEEFLAASSVGQVYRLLSDMGRLTTGVDDTGSAPLGGLAYSGQYVMVDGSWALIVGTHDQQDAGGHPVLVSVYRWVPRDLILVAAADHCLEAAYRGRCPGVDPDALMQWRVESRAAFQRRPAADVLADVERARQILREAVKPYWVGPPTGETMYEIGDDGSFYEVVPEFADLRGQQIPELPEAAAREGIPFLASVKDRDGREKVVLQAASAGLVRRFLAGGLVAGLVDMYGDPARGLAGGYMKGGA